MTATSAPANTYDGADSVHRFHGAKPEFFDAAVRALRALNTVELNHSIAPVVERTVRQGFAFCAVRIAALACHSHSRQALVQTRPQHNRQYSRTSGYQRGPVALARLEPSDPVPSFLCNTHSKDGPQTTGGHTVRCQRSTDTPQRRAELGFAPP